MSKRINFIALFLAFALLLCEINVTAADAPYRHVSDVLSASGKVQDQSLTRSSDVAVTDLGTPELISGRNIGQIAFCRVYEELRTAEIEYCIGTAFQGRGYAGEALSAVIGNIFANTDFQRLEAYHRAENTRSGRVLEKSAMHITDNVERFRQQGITPEGEVCYCIERS